MIAKESDPIHAATRRAQAGARAEQNMAFYLRRAFGDHCPEVLVFHDLRVEHNGEVAQMDHLVVHSHGLFIIESKSISGEIQILPDGQFIRIFGSKRVGMPSPIQQARRQADVLRRLLQANKVTLRDRKLFGMVQGGFSKCPIEIRVAISDQGIIRGDGNVSEVRKADLITEDVERRVAAHRRGGSLLNLDPNNDDGLYQFTPGEMDRLRHFLLEQHRPRARSSSSEETSPQVVSRPAQSKPCPPATRAGARPTSAPPQQSMAVPPAATPVETNTEGAARARYLCSKCHSLDLRVVHGKFGYYFKCQACSGNTWIDTRVEGSDTKGRIRKSGHDFYLVCGDSGREQLIFTNPDEAE